MTTSDHRFIAETTTIIVDNENRDDFELSAYFLLLADPQKQGEGNEKQRVSDIYKG